MKLVNGGFSLVEFDSDPTFPNAYQITQLLKSGTSIIPKTPTEDFADGTKRGVLKQVAMSIRSANVNNGGGSAYALLKAFEIAYTPLWFRFSLLQAIGALIDNCEIWDYTMPYAGVTTGLSSDCKVGSHSGIITVADNASIGNLAAINLDNTVPLTGGYLKFWVKSSIAVAANTLRIWLYAGNNSNTPLGFVCLPALSAGVWTQVSPTIVITDSSQTLVNCYTIFQGVDLGAFTLQIDDFRFGIPNIVVNNIIPSVDFEVNEVGKFNAMKVTGEGAAYLESNLFSLNI